MSNDNNNEQQIKEDMQSLTESFLKWKSKEDPTVTETQKEEFKSFMTEVIEDALKNVRKNE